MASEPDDDDDENCLSTHECESLYLVKARESEMGGVPHSQLQRVESRVSVLTAIPEVGKHEVSLGGLCTYISCHPSLQQAEIVATECHAEDVGAVIHRFLILELHRPGRKDIFLRLDRRRGEGVSLMRFLSGSGKTKANDLAQLASNKAELARGSRRQNRQMFSIPPTLGALKSFLGIILGELDSYRIWPENCWFFCSTIQQYFEWRYTGEFVDGTVSFMPELGIDRRHRIIQRAYSTIPHLLGTEWSSLQGETQKHSSAPFHHALFRNSHTASVVSSTVTSSNVPSIRGVKNHHGKDSNEVYTSDDGTIVGQDSCRPDTKGVESLHSSHRRKPVVLRTEQPKSADSSGDDNATSRQGTERQQDANMPDSFEDQLPLAIGSKVSRDVLEGLGPKGKECVQKQEAVDLARYFYSKQPDKSRANLAQALQELADSLHSAGLCDDACVIGQEHVDVCRELCAASPQKHSVTLALALRYLDYYLDESGNIGQSLSVGSEAVAMFRQLYIANPKEHGSQFSHSIYNLAMAARRLELHKDAYAAFEEALLVHRQLYAHNPGVYLEDLYHTLRHMAATCESLCRYKEACASGEEAIELGHQLLVIDHQRYSEGFSHTVRRQVRCKEKLAAEEAVASII